MFMLQTFAKGRANGFATRGGAIGASRRRSAGKKTLREGLAPETDCFDRPFLG
jgi:hypothetical protein